MSWIEKEAKKADTGLDRIILENPQAIAELDGLLRDPFLPYVVGELTKTGYPFSPITSETEFESGWLGPDLMRSFVFMLFDPLQFPYFRATFSCSRTGFMIDKTFSLGLPKDTDPSILFRILDDSRFRGNPPELTILDSVPHPEWNIHYCIELHAGDGMQTGRWTLHGVAKERLQVLIKDAVEMYENSMVEAFRTVAEVEEFLKIAEQSFGSG